MPLAWVTAHTFYDYEWRNREFSCEQPLQSLFNEEKRNWKSVRKNARTKLSLCVCVCVGEMF